ncbi:unnamed protein product [Didymodactylos carnosus]|uniref:Uncharacterized protein n=1 Tax=Didymodactylos carnosus TaxID=1234261 RepID=A0A8S2HX91_9BILA|nr:unnamed protein product [Didymodactylos carnosus]CAF3670327.1 unnamed protein product [Didymodactylos carnosus]
MFSIDTFIRGQIDDGNDRHISGCGGLLYRLRRGLMYSLGVADRLPCLDRDGYSLADTLSSNFFPLSGHDGWEETYD